MTLQELMNLPHLSIAEQKRLIHLHTEDGWFICNYSEGMDINDYISTNCLYLPVEDEYDEFSVISIDTDRRYKKLLKEKLESK